jgi:hypothetical protein
MLPSVRTSGHRNLIRSRQKKPEKCCPALVVWFRWKDEYHELARWHNCTILVQKIRRLWEDVKILPSCYWLEMDLLHRKSLDRQNGLLFFVFILRSRAVVWGVYITSAVLDTVGLWRWQLWFDVPSHLCRFCSICFHGRFHVGHIRDIYVALVWYRQQTP